MHICINTCYSCTAAKLIPLDEKLSFVSVHTVGYMNNCAEFWYEDKAEFRICRNPLWKGAICLKNPTVGMYRKFSFSCSVAYYDFSKVRLIFIIHDLV